MGSTIGPVFFQRLSTPFPARAGAIFQSGAGVPPADTIGSSAAIGLSRKREVEFKHKAMWLQILGMPCELAADLFRKSWEVAAKINLQNCECSLSQLLSGASRRNCYPGASGGTSRRRRDDNVHVEQKCCRRDRGTA
jgi:hypothetical protein